MEGKTAAIAPKDAVTEKQLSIIRQVYNTINRDSSTMRLVSGEAPDKAEGRRAGSIMPVIICVSWSLNDTEKRAGIAANIISSPRNCVCIIH